MNLDQVAVATLTRTRRLDEQRLIANALRSLTTTGVPVVVSDRGSAPAFIKAIERMPNLVLVPPNGQGLVGQIRASVERARQTHRPFILYTEPDKRQFFDDGLRDFVDRIADRPNLGIVLASRSEAAFNTFPAFQRLTEMAANDLCSGVVGVTTDYFYGPFLMRGSLVREVLTAPSSLGWGWRPFLFVRARRRGYRIRSVTGRYQCPRGQRVEREPDKRHRIAQLTDNMRGLIAALGRSSTPAAPGGTSAR